MKNARDAAGMVIQQEVGSGAVKRISLHYGALGGGAAGSENALLLTLTPL